MPLPTANMNAPPVPPVAAPVDIDKIPLVPELEVPVLNTIAPLTPREPEFRVPKEILPLLVDIPAPAVTEIAPPVST
jgi:hypothetical protein